MQERVLRIQMFGGFSMYYGGEAVALNKTGNSKAIRLLQMLLLSPKAGIAKRELLDNLYGWNDKTDTANRNKNLNNLIYRLKKQLVSGGLPEDEYVGLNEGMCYFKSSIPLEVDTQQFEESVNSAKIQAGGGKMPAYTARLSTYIEESCFLRTFRMCGFSAKANTLKKSMSTQY